MNSRNHVSWPRTLEIFVRTLFFKSLMIAFLTFAFSSLMSNEIHAQVTTQFCRPDQTPQFVHGFAELKRHLGDVMGDPMTCEYPDSNMTGDMHQRTTHGLAFYRKITNTPTFTNGYDHWALTGEGLVYWVGGNVDPPGSHVATQSPQTFQGEHCLRVVHHEWLQDRLTSWPSDYQVLIGRVRNVCRGTVSGLIEMRQPMEVATGQAVGKVLSGSYIRNLEPGSERQFVITVTELPGVRQYRLEYIYHSAILDLPGSGLPCYSLVDQVGCIESDPRIAESLAELRKVERGRWLQSVAAKWGVVIHVSHLPIGTLASYRPSTRAIAIDDRLMKYDRRVRTAILAHELQHAADHAAGKLGDGRTCFGNEEDAFQRQAEIWLALWDNRLPEAADSIERELNLIASLAVRDPYALQASIVGNYGHQCD